MGKHSRHSGPKPPAKKGGDSGSSLLRRLPQVEKVLHLPQVAALVDRHPRPLVVRTIRDCLADLRGAILSDSGPPAGLLERIEPVSIAREVSGRLSLADRAAYRRAVNATGIILHTALGRAVYPAEARAAIAGAVEGYAVVEVDVESGERNLREVHLADLLRELTGAEAATVVNNNAAATLIILAALARGKEVVISHGQLVEIGGAFRIPEVMAEGGARLVAVGTTNRTYISDYRRAIGPETGLLLQVHTSNYDIVGFAHHTPLEELVELGRERALPVVSDLGSGCFIDLSPYGLRREPLVADSVRAGADLVCFSGDKLLGGPQAGIIVGRKEAVEKVRRHPLFRAMRVDKMTLAGLEAVLRLYRDPARALKSVPALRMVTAEEREVRARATRFARSLKKERPRAEAEVTRSAAQTGSGSLPGQDLPSWAVAAGVPGRDPDSLAKELRAGDPPIFSRISEGSVLLDFRTVLPGEEKILLAAFRRLIPE